jgi:UDP-N-acetylmuramate--alanine ligase
MHPDRPYFFCGIGGSGMLPLALILRTHGARVLGSDRALDQGRLAEKFAYLRANGIELFPQDGSGVTSRDMILVTSTAVEETIPDVEVAKRLGVRRMLRAELLAELFNQAPNAIGVAGTSGKSTTTAMIGWILHTTGRDPTIMNGAVMKNFISKEAPFASALVGKSDLFVSEVDESDGSIAWFSPRVAVLNNIALDHKSLDELRALFRNFAGKSEIAVLNLDNDETAALAAERARSEVLTYSLVSTKADLFASDIEPMPDGIAFKLSERNAPSSVAVRLRVPGRHNVSNALAAIGAARTAGISLTDIAAALGTFAGVRRRLEIVGSANGINVIDDFAHNPDKIAATLTTLHDFPGRLLVMFQPHGYGPLRLMKDQLIDCFARNMCGDDVLVMPEPVYFGGTTERSVSSIDIVKGVVAKGRDAHVYSDRAQCGEHLVEIARPGDRVVVMGARDDTLSQFAGELLKRFELDRGRNG